MASTTFTDNITPIAASWLNDVNSATYTILGNGTSYTGVLTLAGTTDSTSTTTGMIINAGGAGIAKALWVGGLANIAGAVTLQNDLAVNGGDLTTSATTFNLLNTTATTVNFAGGASTALNIGNASGTNTVLGATTFSQAGVFSSTLGVAGKITSTVGNNATFLESLSATDGYQQMKIANDFGGLIIGVEDSSGGNAIVGSTAYDATISGITGLSFSGNNGSALHMRIASSGAVTIPGTLGIGAAASNLDSYTAFAQVVGTDSAGFSIKRTDATAQEYIFDVVSGDLRIRNKTASTVPLTITSAGAVTIPSLAGTGTRAVVVDANGVMSAP